MKRTFCPQRVKHILSAISFPLLIIIYSTRTPGLSRLRVDKIIDVFWTSQVQLRIENYIGQHPTYLSNIIEFPATPLFPVVARFLGIRSYF